MAWPVSPSGSPEAKPRTVTTARRRSAAASKREAEAALPAGTVMGEILGRGSRASGRRCAHVVTIPDNDPIARDTSYASAFSAEDFRASLGMFATGVTIVTALDREGRPVGITANSFN